MIPGSWFFVPGSSCLVLGSWCLVLGWDYGVLGAKSVEQRARGSVESSGLSGIASNLDKHLSDF